MYLFQAIARAGENEGRPSWENTLELCEYLLPTGSGIDAGTGIKYAGMDRVVLTTAFHHLNEVGMYTHWTDHEVIVTPVLGVEMFHLVITGPDDNGIIEYLYDVFGESLMQQVTIEYDKSKDAMVVSEA